MASTEQIRKWYHSGVVLNHADRGTTGYHPHCDHDHPKVSIPRDGGGVWVRAAHPFTTEAFEAYIQVMNHHGETMPGAGGLGNCRNIGDTNRPSLHAYLCAIDLPPNNRKSAGFIADVEKIRTRSDGVVEVFPAQVFRNLTGDRMHDQINCSPKALATGIDRTTVVGDHQGDDMAFLTEAQQKELVKFLDLIDAKNSNVGFVNQAIDDIRQKNAAGDKYAPAGSVHTKSESDARYAMRTHNHPPGDHSHKTEGRTV